MVLAFTLERRGRRSCTELLRGANRLNDQNRRRARLVVVYWIFWEPNHKPMMEFVAVADETSKIKLLTPVTCWGF